MSEVVGLSLPDGAGTVWFEVADDRWVPASSGRSVVGRLDEALRPLISGARLVIDQVRELAPDEVEVEFGAKLAGEAGWIFAKASSEGNLKVTLKWAADRPDSASGR